jgi:beta-lactamase superfamily II metal-dependent hydrolase
LLGLGDVGGLVLHPTREFVDGEGHSPHGLNNGSVVLKLSYGEVDLLFAGDIEGETDAALLAWGGRLQAEVLRTDRRGAVLLRSDGTQISVEAMVDLVQPRP